MQLLSLFITQKPINLSSFWKENSIYPLPSIHIVSKLVKVMEYNYRTSNFEIENATSKCINNKLQWKDKGIDHQMGFIEIVRIQK